MASRWRGRAERGNFEVDSSARRTSGTGEREYSITLTVGGISGFSIPWEGTSFDDARDSFLQYLFNHREFGVSSEEPMCYFRSLMANFNGRTVLVTFRTSWITAFTVG